MVFFRKNKRQFGIRSHRNLFVAIFLIALFGISGIISLIMNAMAADVPVPSIEILSQNSSYPDGHPGAWRVTKSAEWTDVGKARITFEIDSITKTDSSKKLDVVMVVDISGSMSGDKLTQVKNDASDLTETLLSSPDNNIALVQFESDARILSGLTNNKSEMLNLIDGLSVAGCTNYYDGLLKAEEVLDGYVQQDDRELVLLFLTDGYPNEQTPNEIAQYQTLKTKYPYMIINGIQYEMGDEVLQPIIDVSDNQFIANRDSLHNVLYEATITPYIYDEFVITDLINEEYWTVAGLAALNATLGDYKLEYDGSTPKITWDLSGLYRTGQSAKLTIEVNLKSEFINMSDLLLPTNDGEEIKTKLPDAPDEDVDSQDSPILKDHYDVIYDDNAPEGCNVTGAVPETTSHTIFTPVEISDNQLSCQNYDFKGWRIATEDVPRINDDYFRMPGKDVYINAIWAKPSVSKSMDGEPHTRGTATFMFGTSLNERMKRMSGQSGSTNSANDVITAFLKADSMSQSAEIYTLSDSRSQLPIYGWFDNGTIYYYTDADDIYMNEDSRFTFYNLTALNNIDGLKYVDTSKTTNFVNMFGLAKSLTNIDALSNWDTSNVTTMSGLFYATASLENINGALNWDTSKVTSTSSMFSSTRSLTNIDGAINWDLSNVVDANGMFAYSYELTNIDGAINWDMSSVTNMGTMFWGSSKLTNIDGAINWDTSNVTTMASMFSDAAGLLNIDGAQNWNTGSVTNMGNMFGGATSLSNIDGAQNWNTGSVTNMGNMFMRTGITSIDKLNKWNTSNVTTMSGMFNGASKLQNIDGAQNWNTGSVTNMSQMFSDATSLTSISGALKWDTSNVTDLEQLLYRASSLSSLYGLNNWDTGNVQNLSQAFSRTNISNLSGLENWNTGSVTNMSYVFYWDNELTDTSALENWNVSSVTNMSGLFAYDRKLATISGVKKWNTSSVKVITNIFDVDEKLKDISELANWDTSNVINFKGAFSHTYILNDISALSNWDTSKAEDTSEMFYRSGLTNVDALLNWDMSHVQNIRIMFSEMRKGTLNIDSLRKWDVSSVKNMDGLFARSSINSVDGLENWITSNVTEMENMFSYVRTITDISKISGWDTSNVKNMSNMFYYASSITDFSPMNNWNVDSVTNMTNAFYGISSSVDPPTWYH